MVNPGLTIKLFDFQEQAVLKLLDLTAKQTSKQTVVMKAPTGSGKTIIWCCIIKVDTLFSRILIYN
ncbi:DEAD/DEAH box helicase family protein, partial [Flavonifractor plautii]